MIMGNSVFEFSFSQFFDELDGHFYETKIPENADILILLGEFNPKMHKKICHSIDRLPGHSKIVRFSSNLKLFESQNYPLDFDIHKDELTSSVVSSVIRDVQKELLEDLGHKVRE